jgi:hypothetical protein
VFEAANIREWRGHDLADAEGRKIGELEAVDTGTDLPRSPRSRLECRPGTGSCLYLLTRRPWVRGTSWSPTPGSK